jgi:ABC-2 type transport system permease protein
VIRVIRSEVLKLRTTKAWWLMLIGALATTVLALLFNGLNAHYSDLNTEVQAPPSGMPDDQKAEFEQEQQAHVAAAKSVATAIKVAADMFTSGQYFGVMFIMLLGAMIVTNEYFHQTATATFLATPHRTTVIVSKLVAAIGLATLFWAITTAVDLAAGAVFLSKEGVDNHLGDWEVVRAILLNLAAYACWAVLGVGLGVLLRSQIAAVVTGTVLYLIGTFAANLIFALVHEYLIKKDWVLTAQVAVPAIASQVMVTAGKAFDHAPPQWVGAAVLIGYGLVFGILGTLITRKRDIS